MDKQTLIQIIKEEVEKLLFEEKKHAMYHPETGEKIMADGEKHTELASKGYVHFDPKKVIAAIDKEGGAAGLDAIVKHTGADKKELQNSISKIKGVVKHSKGDFITVKSDRQVAEEIIKQEIEAVLNEKRKKKKKKSSGKKDACYHKVKSRYKVWPSAYASGALVKCRKVGAKNWGNKSKKK
tara:strand:+ start:42 stop:587 length:546 start_codon:yes stop_codon:yes gene_type:complete